jgi:MFS family permease
MKKDLELGLRENWRQFTWLVVINGFVGGMIGLERSILPQLAESEFGIASKTALLSFIIAFGITKAFSNYFAGRLANRVGRKNLLVTGWLFALPVPFLLIYAGSWNWVVFANILLGINQGLTWSSTVVMKIDLVGEKRRGLAMGINEFAGYVFVGLTAFLTSYLAGIYGVRPVPFYLGIVFSVLGLALSALFVKDTVHHVHKEKQISNLPLLRNPFWETTFKHRSLGSVTQAGLVNNLNDGMIWGLLPLLLFAKNFDNAQIGILTAIYPTVWGVSQLLTGKMSDHFSKKLLLFWGMLLQALGILALIWAQTFLHFAAIGFALGIGTAVVYPTFLAAIADYTNPAQRAESLGVFRFWRDLGYAVGAILTGITADFLGIGSSIIIIALLTAISGFLILLRMQPPVKASKIADMEVQTI